MLRLWFALVCVSACASAPIVGVERVRARPAGPAVLSDAEARWQQFLIAHEPQFVAALALAETRAGVPSRGVNGAPATRTPGGEQRYVPAWRPDDEQFVIELASRRTITVRWVLAVTGCGKHYGLQPAPCQPPIPTMTEGAFAAETTLVLVYDRTGRFLSERSSGPAPVLIASSKR